MWWLISLPQQNTTNRIFIQERINEFFGSGMVPDELPLKLWDYDFMPLYTANKFFNFRDYFSKNNRAIATGRR
jgi:hypothetical protein